MADSRLSACLWPRLSALLLGLGAEPAMADDQLWMAVETRGEIADGLLLLADGNFRLVDGASHRGQVQIRGFLGHDFGPAILAAGYSWARTSRPQQIARVEHRLSQQAEYGLLTTGSGVKLAGRTRLEQRFFADRGGCSWRLRQRLKLTVPVGNGWGSGGLALMAHGELLAALTGGPSGAPGGQLQSRLFAGVLLPISSRAGVEAGYLNQYDWRYGEANNNVLSLNLVTRF